MLRGQRDDLLNVAYAKLTVDISDATRSVIQTESVQLYDNDDNPVDNSNIRTNASLIQAKVPVLTTKEVSLAVELSGVPGSAGQSIKTTITPSSVRLIGEADVLENIDEIVLATLYIEDLDIWQQNSYVVTAPDGTWLANSNEVATVEITMEGIEEKTVTVDTFSYTNVPSGLYAEVLDTLDVRLWGLSEELAELEAERCPSLDRPADAFAVLLAGAAQGIADPVKRRVAEQLLYHLGRWVYLVDAADDLKEDLKTGSYNPLVLRFRVQDGALSEEDRQQLAGTLDGSVRAMAAAFELADFGVYAPVLRAAVYEGLYIVGAAVLNGTFHRRRRERQAIRKADTNDA